MWLNDVAFSLQLSALKQSREAEEQRLLQHQEQGEELQALRGQVRQCGEGGGTTGELGSGE